MPLGFTSQTCRRQPNDRSSLLHQARRPDADRAVIFFRRTDRVQKRQSNVMKLAEQNERLKEELRAMTERLEAAERKQKDLETRARRSAEGAR